MADKITLQQVAQLVASSPNFTPDEATEWLRLVPLMNDQQLREVTRILQAMAGEAPMPQDLQQYSQVSQPASSPAPAAPHLPTPEAVSKPVSAAPIATPQMEMSAPASPVYSKEISDALSQLSGGSNAVRMMDQPMPSNPIIASMGQPTSKQVLKGVALHQIQSLEDVNQVSVESLRAWGEEGLFAALKNMVVEFGWPTVRMEFEQSPLFVAYVDTGRHSLGDNVGDGKEKLLERREFESVADLLQRLAAIG